MNFLLHTSFRALLLLIACLSSFTFKAQERDESDTELPPTDTIHKGLHLGIYVGSFFANKYSANMYDGYGFDVNGARNNFANSILYNQIVNVYGGGYGGPDQIAQLLNVDHKDWFFTEANMPFNLSYTTTYLVGLNMRYTINKQSSVTINVNGTKLSVNGKFNITTINNSGNTSGSAGQSKQHEFTIVGGEQRLMFQLGYQRILGDNDKLNFFVEGGLNVILSKFQKNQAFLTSNQNNGQYNISIDLMSVYNQDIYAYYRSKYFVGVGLGVYAAGGLNLTINPKYTVQLLYSPSYDKIKLGNNPAFKLQHGFGLRFYYNLN